MLLPCRVVPVPIVGKWILEKSFYFVNVNTCDTWLERNVGPSTDGAVVLLEGSVCHRIPVYCLLYKERLPEHH